MAQNTALVDEYNSPLNAEQAGQLSSLIGSLSANQATWVSGYLAGLNAGAATGQVASQEAVAPTPPAQSREPVTVLYGSQTGNAETIAGQFAARAEAEGLAVNLVDMLEYKPRDLKKEKNIVICAATHGEGSPPDSAEELHEFIYGKKAPKLEGVKFSVLAFGDSSYEYFCQTGRDFDSQLEKLGATRLAERVDLDVDFDEPAEAWVEDAVVRFKEEVGAVQNAKHSNVTVLPGVAGKPAANEWSRKNPYASEMLNNVVLNGRRSDKEIHHIELDTEDSGLTWEPGDSLGIIPANDPALVAELIAALAPMPATR
jgi:sulfite reductase (NADPH) flavoprotein alpha-component